MNPKLDAIHDQILAALEVVPPPSWSVSEASFVLAALNSLIGVRKHQRDPESNVVLFRLAAR